MQKTLKAVALLALSLATVALAACGSEDGDGTVTSKVLEETTKAFPGDPGQWVIELEADPDGELAFTTDEIVSPPGNTNIVFENPQSVGHDVVIERPDGREAARTKVVTNGSAWTRPYVEPGENYVFYCSVPGHREAGMEGTIVLDPELETEDLEVFFG